MKLLEQFYDLNEATNLAWKFRQKGILTHISSQRSHQLGSIKTGALKVGLWIVVKKQYNDAKMLLRNKHHNVMYKLSEEEMQAIENEAKNSFYPDISIPRTKTMNKLMLIVFLCFIAFVSYKLISTL